MARKKNALRLHEIAPWSSSDTAAPTTGFLALAEFITTVNDNSEEKTETFADYAGDGNEIDYLVGRAEKWDFEGTWNPTNPAQKLIAEKKRSQNDDDRKVWFRITENDGTVVLGVAKALNIVAGSGDAAAYEDFKCSLIYAETPTITPGA
ncbi:MAG: phage tail protein [Streptococcaceae bacterium]|jgi:hypothetical protein|nr:phage tail protein [Streptococcaceae bacterium]MCL2680898.1 phage tail protein [Streptococcaceae bacterium]MCL2858094.1 phage tail protein [Streptococcaceae bacterium]